MKHTFVICAYKESKYLEDCIRSLKAQEVKSYIKIATSTPNEYIYSIANKLVCLSIGLYFTDDFRCREVGFFI